METLIAWGVGLFGVAGLLFFVELLLPTGGVLGLASFLSGVAGVVAFWTHDTTLGISALIALMVLTPLAFHFALRVIPNTPIGRMLILGDEEQDLERAEALHTQQMHAFDALIGAEGRAATDLRPSGTVEIEGETHDALAEAGVIEVGSRIRVVAIVGSSVKVRAI